MPSAHARYFLGNELLGESKLPETFALPSSLAYFCLTCGETWARIWIEESGWAVICVPCHAHQPAGVQDWGSHPGSLLNPFITRKLVGLDSWASCIEHLPPVILRREFELALKEIENENDLALHG